jgi:hypothetical protein
MSKQQIVSKLTQPKVKTFLKKYGILKLSLFGSYSRNEANTDSDIDLLYIQDKKRELGLEFFDVVSFLEETLKRKVDMVEKSFLNKKLQKYVLADKIDIF